MRRFLLCLSAALLAGVVARVAPGQSVPEKLTFATKNGNVIFDHAAHAQRAKDDCAACHDKLFKEDAHAALNYKAGIHKTAEMNKTSCGSCHRAGGTAFESKSNCAKCHVKS